MAGENSIRTRASKVFRGARDRYLNLGRYQRLRFMFVSLFVLDIVVTGLFVVTMLTSHDALAVSFRSEFPTRLLIVRNGEKVLEDAEVVLDGRYHFVIPRLELGPIGIDLRDFRDQRGFPPDDAYRPGHALIKTEAESFHLRVSAHDAAP